MDAEVIAIGDELTSGVRLDTNSQWLSERLGELGVRVLYHATVGDDLDANVRVFREAIDRSDIVLCTGGLGPTADDLTRDALAAATGKDLQQNTEALAHIEAIFASRQRPMPERNVQQAMFPAGSRVVHNPHGTAPGIDLEIARQGREPCRIFALPGVPAEMKEMWEQTVVRELTTTLGGTPRVIRHRRVKCFGVGESDLEQMLPDLIRRGRTPSVGITVSKATITLRVTADGENEAACFAAMEPTMEIIREKLGDIIFGYEDEELQHVILNMLAARGQTLSVVEFGTGGLICDWMSALDDPGEVFVGGSVIRNQVALRHNWGPLGEHDSAWENGDLAVACRERFGSDYSLAIGAFPPLSGLEDEPGRVACSLAAGETTHIKQFRHIGHPDIIKARTAKSALNLLRLHLLATC